MVRGGRGYSSRGSSYRGSRGGNPWSNGGGGGGGYQRGSRDRYSSFDDSFDKGRYSERYMREEYPKPYRMDTYRERHSPERKRPRHEGPPRHEYGGGNRYESYPSERRYSGGERHVSSPYGGSSRREEFRKPPPQSPSRGRLSSRGSRGMRRERGGPLSRRLADRSYTLRKRGRWSTRGLTKAALRSGILRRRRGVLNDSDEKESSGEEEKIKEEATENPEDEAAEVKEEATEVEGEEKKEGEAGTSPEKPKEKKEKKATDEIKKLANKIFIKLVCPQCNIKVPTFRRYEHHLEGQSHAFAMRKVAAKQRVILAQMRQAQRNTQNELEKSADGITDHTVFCPLCKLNYKQERAVHQATSAHKNMRKFLMPTCKTCKLTFKSPMIYEHHLCSVEHLKTKQRLEASGVSADDNLEEFTTIDSVGEVGDDNAASGDEKKKEEKKKRVSVGIEQIKKIEAYYCDLCRMFLPRGTENEYPDILAGHCRKRFHMARYVRAKESLMKKKAEELQEEENVEKETKKEEGEENKEAEEAKASEEVKEGDPNDESKDACKSADDDKLWDAVDKDLGELLEETDGREDDDDEERVNGERYDRFKSGDEAKKAEETKVAEEIKN